MIKQRGKYRDDLKFWCSVIYDDHIFLHHFVYYLSLGLPLTKTAYTQWRSTCATKQLEVPLLSFEHKMSLSEIGVYVQHLLFSTSNNS